MFGNKFLLTIRNYIYRLFIGSNTYTVPFVFLPAVFHHKRIIAFYPVVACRQGFVVFLIQHIRNKGKRRSRNNFLNKYHSPFITFGILILHVKAKVDFLKIDMKRDFKLQYFSIYKHKTYKAYIAGTVPLVEFSIKRYIRLQYFWVNGIVNHNQFTPLCIKECFFHWLVMFIYL